MGQAVFRCAQIVGHQYVNASGYTVGMSLYSGSLPAWGTYTITNAVLEISAVRSDLQHEVNAYKNSAAESNLIGSGWNHSSPGYVQLSKNVDYSGLSSLVLCGVGGTAMQIASGAYITITIDYTVNASGLTPGASSVAAGSALSSSIAANDASYTHTLVYSLGNASASHDLAAGVASDSLTIPMDWLNQFPYADSATMTLTLYTKSGGSVIGQTTAQVTVTCPASVIPVIGSATAAPNGSVSVGSGRYVRTRDGVTVTMTGVAEAYGVIVATGIAVGGYGGNGYNASGSGNLTFASDALPYAGNVTITCWARDGRGRTTTVTLTITVTDYNAPAVTTLSAQRVDASGNANPSGTLGKRTLAYSVSAVGGNYVCSATLTLTQAGTTLLTESSPVTSDWLQSGGSNIALDLSKEYVLQLTLTDNYTTVARSVTIPTAQAVLSITPAFDGVAFGMVADQSAAVEVSPEWGLRIHGKEILDLIYPVGSYFWSSVATSPASLFGGTWEQITGRFLLSAGKPAANTDNQFGAINGICNASAGSTGGQTYHTMTEAETCPHAHSYGGGWTLSWGGDHPNYTMINASAVLGNPATINAPWFLGTATASVGGGAAHNNMPPYLSAYCWHRTA